MKIAWALMAEGVAQDAKGVFSLIGINQNLLFTDSLPTQTKRVMLVHLEGEPNEGATDFANANITFSVVSPSGAVLSANSGQVQGAEFPFQDLPATADIPFEAVIPVRQLGEHKLQFSIAYDGGRSEETSISLYVLDSAQNPQRVG